MKIQIDQCNRASYGNRFDNTLRIELKDREYSSWVLQSGRPVTKLSVGGIWSLEDEGDNSLTVYTLPEEGQWVLSGYGDGVDLSNEVEKQLSILNNLYPGIVGSLTRDYRYIKSKRDLLLFLKSDLHRSNVYVFTLNHKRDFEHDLYQNILLKNVYSLNSVDDYRKIIYNGLYLYRDLSLVPSSFYRLSNNQRLFVNSGDNLNFILPLNSFTDDRIHILSDSLSHLEISDNKHDNHTSLTEEDNNLFRDVIFTTSDEELVLVSDTYAKIDGKLVVDFNNPDIVNRSAMSFNTGEMESVCIYEPLEKVYSSYGILYGHEIDEKGREVNTIKSVFPYNMVMSFDVKPGFYKLEMYDGFTKSGVKILLEIKKEINMELKLFSLKQKKYENIKDKNLLLYNDGRWRYKITEKERSGSFKIQEFQILYTGASGDIRPFLPEPGDYVYGCKCVLVMNDDVYYLQYIHEYESHINPLPIPNDLIYHWKRYDTSMDFYQFLHNDEKIDHFNRHYVIFGGDNF